MSYLEGGLKLGTTKCPKCGANDWWIDVFELREGHLNEKGVMIVERNKDNGVDRVQCRNCRVEYHADDLKFNWHEEGSTTENN